MNTESILVTLIGAFVIVLTLSITYIYGLKIQAGLEECPQYIALKNTNTIWVRDCNAYTAERYKYLNMKNK